MISPMHCMPSDVETTVWLKVTSTIATDKRLKRNCNIEGGFGLCLGLCLLWVTFFNLLLIYLFCENQSPLMLPPSYLCSCFFSFTFSMFFFPMDDFYFTHRWRWQALCCKIQWHSIPGEVSRKDRQPQIHYCCTDTSHVPRNWEHWPWCIDAKITTSDFQRFALFLRWKKNRRTGSE